MDKFFSQLLEQKMAQKMEQKKNQSTTSVEDIFDQLFSKGVDDKHLHSMTPPDIFNQEEAEEIDEKPLNPMIKMVLDHIYSNMNSDQMRIFIKKQEEMIEYGMDKLEQKLEEESPVCRFNHDLSDILLRRSQEQEFLSSIEFKKHSKPLQSYFCFDQNFNRESNDLRDCFLNEVNQIQKESQILRARIDF